MQGTGEGRRRPTLAVGPRASLAVLALALLLPLVLSGCGGSRPPPATPTAAPSPPAADVTLDLDLADKLRHDGDVKQAIAIYNAVAQLNEGPDQLRALESLAHVYYQEGRLEEAAAALTALLDASPAPEERGRAHLLLGRALQQLGRPDEAKESLEIYIEGGAAATAHARLALASALTAAGDETAAIDELELALAEGLPPSQETDALFALARAQEAAGRQAEALATWERASVDGATATQRGEALWLLAALAGRTGRDDALQEHALLSLVRDYPRHARALEALAQAPPLLTSADRGIVLFNHDQNEQAVAAFQASLQQDGSASGRATAHYYLALLAERADQPDEALSEYDAALAALEGLEGEFVFGEAAWERALLLEALGRGEEAVAAYAQLADASPGSQRAPEAAFRAGFLRFHGGLPGEAISHWNRYLELAGGAAETARARFWLGKAALATGDTASADVHLNEAALAAPWSYFGLRAGAILAGQPPLSLSEPAPEPAAPDWAAVEAWLASWAGPEDAAARRELTEGVPWRRGVELLLAGLTDEARDQFTALMNDAAGQPWPMYRLARGLDERGQTEAAARAAARLIGDRADAPPDLLRIAYPDDYLDLAAAEAEANAFPPLLLLALIRQESFFQPDAESFAGALGLTQVIPSTADEIAGQLDEEGFTYADLLRPSVSLRFGAHYLGSQLELFEGDVPAALAAYNGGPGNSLRWRESAPDDPDAFLETIDLAETRAYVELVLEHYARYRYAYGLAEGPALPLS